MIDYKILTKKKQELDSHRPLNSSLDIYLEAIKNII